MRATEQHGAIKFCNKSLRHLGCLVRFWLSFLALLLLMLILSIAISVLLAPKYNVLYPHVCYNYV